MIEAKGLTKAYPGIVAVSDLSFSVGAGEITGFLGPNGAGKTTTMRMLTCFIPPTAGTAAVAGHDIRRDPIGVRRTLGYLPETNPLYTDMRIEEYLEYRARLKGLDRARRRSRVEEVVRRTGLAEIAARRQLIGHLSKGQRQRVGLADALVHDPPVLILDEPTIGLDPNQIREVRQLIQDLGKEKTIMLSSHILSEVEATCRRVIILHQGRLLAEGTAEEVARKFGTSGRIRMEVEGDGRPVKEGLDGIAEVERVLWNQRDGINVFIIDSKNGADIRRDIFEMARARAWRLKELAWERLSLEETFARLTGGN